MNIAKQINEQTVDETILNLRLAKYYDLNNKVKELDKELEALKAEFKHLGNTNSQDYILTVTESLRETAPSKDILIAQYGEAIKQLFKISIVNTVKVIKKG